MISFIVSLDVKKYDGTTFYASGCTFTGNSSEEDGGAFFLRDNPQHGASVMFDNCVFKNNTAKEDGGAITAFDDSLVLSNVTITGNQAGGYGTNAKKSKTYVIYMNGDVTKASSGTKILPGCEIVVPMKMRNRMTTTETVALGTGVASIATMIATLVNIIKK